MTPIQYLNAAKKALDVDTHYALAKALDYPNPIIYDCYVGKRVPDEELCAKLALALNLSFAEVMADIRGQTAKTERAREFWRSFLARTRSAALITGLLICGVFCGLAPLQYEGGAGRFNRR